MPKASKETTEYTAVEFLDQGSGIAAIAGSAHCHFQQNRAIEELILRNWSVFTPNGWDQSFNPGDGDKFFSSQHISRLTRLPFRKIYDSHVLIVVTDLTGQADPPARQQKRFADQLGLPVFFFNGFFFSGTTKSAIVQMDDSDFDTELDAIASDLALEDF